MRIAVISDIHGNIPALEAAWRSIATFSPDMTLCLGDLVHFGPSPDQVVSFIRTHGVETVQGNCDRAAGRGRTDSGDVFENPHWRKLASETLAWTRENLSAESTAFLRSLPDDKRYLLDRQSALFVHGLPGRLNEGIPAETAHEVHDILLGRNDCRILVCGHTHEPMVVRRPGGIIVNPGAVGAGTLPAGGTLAVIDIGEGVEPAVEIARFDYNVRALELDFREARIPETFFNCARLGRDPRGPWHTEDPRLKQEWAGTVPL